MDVFTGYRYRSRPGPTLALAMRLWSPQHSINLLLGCLVAILWPLLVSGPAHAAGQALVGQKIRYHHSQAGEVFIMWGINGWYKAPEAQWPPGTVPYNDKNKYPYTAMTREGEAFVATIQAPLGTTIDYVFNITKNSNGESVDVWDIKNEEVRDYHTVVIPDTIAEAYSVMPLEQEAPADPLSIGLRWGVPALLVVVFLIGGVIWLRRKLRNPFLDF
jgi:hypothetical protein